jgi:acyl-CoA thioester hydrolase
MSGRHSCSTVRVRYAETDQMGVAYHGDYFAWFEVGRTDLLRQLGLTYKELEAEDVRLPVVETRVQFRRPALYDDVLEIRTRLVEMTGVRLTFEYDVVRSSDEEALAQAMTCHAAVDAKGRPRRLPEELRRRLQ